MSEVDGRFALTVPVLMSFPTLFEPKRFKRNGKESGEPKYSANLNFEKDNPDLAAIRPIVGQIAKAKWPGRDFKTEIAGGLFKLPFTKGDKLADDRKAKNPDKDDGEFQRDKVVIIARSKYQPSLSVVDGGRIIDLEEEALIAKYRDKFFFGALVLAEFNFVAYEGGNGPDGVTGYLNKILATGKGTKLSSGSSGADVFRGYVGSVSAEDPTDELDDEIPF